MSEDAPETLMARMTRLTVAASKLGKEVAQNTRELAQNTSAIQDLMRRAKLAERFIAIISVSLIMDFILTGAVAWLAYQSYNTNERIATICPLYAFTIGTYAPLSRAAGADRDQYNASFDKMRLKFGELGCGPDYPIVPGAAHPPTASAPGN